MRFIHALLDILVMRSHRTPRVKPIDQHIKLMPPKRVNGVCKVNIVVTTKVSNDIWPKVKDTYFFLVSLAPKSSSVTSLGVSSMPLIARMA